MTVADLRRVLAQCKPESEVLIRLDDEFFENPNGNVAEILGHDYSYGCTETLALMLECGQPNPDPAWCYVCDRPKDDCACEVTEYPHASDCASWVGETCDCVTGKLS